MGEIIKVYGTEIELPEQPMGSLIDYWNLPKEKQYWRKKELPKIFDVVATTEEGEPVLNAEQRLYVEEEIKKIRDGYWFFNNGVATYITGRHYFYLQYWTLETRRPPDYRDVSRRYFLFLDHWHKNEWCLGIVRGKGRRSGATSECSSNLIYSGTQNENANCGIVSKTNADARKVFVFKTSFGYRHLPFFMKPEQENAEDAKTEIRWSKPIDRSKKKKEFKIKGDVGGLNSRLDFQPTALNSYDSERMFWVLADEGGKWPKEVPFSQFISILSETLVQGSLKVGFVEAPSTVNEMTKSGGAEYKEVWTGANQFKVFIAEDGEIMEETANRFVRYFVPAYDGLEGFIDQYGMSIIENPTQEQKDWVLYKYKKKIKYGAKEYLQRKRDKLEGKKLEEEIRKYPFTEDEMFMSSDTNCHFNSMNINMQLKRIEESNLKLRIGKFQRNLQGLVEFKDDMNGAWSILAFPPNGEENKFKMERGLQRPARADDGVIGVDGYSNSQGGRKYGSHAAAYIYRKLDISDPENTGLFIAEYYDRPKTKELFHEQMLLAAEFYGYPIWYEHTADDYLSHFRGLGKVGYLGKYPRNSIVPDKLATAERYYGFPISPFAMTKQLDSLISFVEYHCEKIYFIRLLDNCLIFEADKRTDYDCVVASMIALVCGLESSIQKQPKKVHQYIKTYKNPRYQMSAN